MIIKDIRQITVFLPEEYSLYSALDSLPDWKMIHGNTGKVTFEKVTEIYDKTLTNKENDQ